MLPTQFTKSHSKSCSRPCLSRLLCSTFRTKRENASAEIASQPIGEDEVEGPKTGLSRASALNLVAKLVNPGSWRVGTSKEYFRYRPPIESFEPPSIQVGDRVYFFGGFSGALDTVCRQIQILNIATDQWEKPVPIPEDMADSHQGLAFDEKSRFIYSISGQLGGGCATTTKRSFRMHIDTLETQEIPPLPYGRYNPGVAIWGDHLHVFGGSNERRNMSALDHWVVDVGKAFRTGGALRSDSWTRVSDLPVSGCHGESFRFGHHLYHLGGCYVDQGVSRNSQCHVTAVQDGLFVHHVPVPASAYRYDLKGRPGDTVWEKIPDMPVSVCVAPALLVGPFAVFFGGASAERQQRRGTPPRSERVVQALDLERLQWTVVGELPASATGALFHCSVWHAQTKAAHVFHMIRTAEYRQPGQKVQASTYLVAKIPSASLIASDRPARAKQRSLGLRVSVVSKSHPRDWRSWSVVEEGFLACLRQHTPRGADPILVVTKRNSQLRYNRARVKRNGAHHHMHYPIAIVKPASRSEAGVAVKCAVGSGLQVCGRNGKHAFEALGCTHGVVMDMRKLSEMEVLAEQEGKGSGGVQVHVGAGNMLGMVAAKAVARRLWLPAGVCPTVGATGLALVGGQGMLSRLHGLTADRLEGLEMVDYTGEVVRVSDTQNAELLWLAKGGGGYEHFPGIITGLTFRFIEIDPAEKKWVKFKAVIHDPLSQVDEAFRFWQSWAPNHPDRRLTVELWVARQWDSKISAHFTGLFFGPKHEFEALWLAEVEPVIRANMTCNETGALDYMIAAGGVKSESALLSGKHGWDAYGSAWKGRSFVANKIMHNVSAFSDLARHILTIQGRMYLYLELKPLGGAIAEVKASESAFWHRQASWWGLFQTFWPWWEEAEEHIERSAQAYGRMVAGMQQQGVYGGQYVGYVDHDGAPSRGQELRNYYGDNLERIQDIRRKWDPSGVFRHANPKVEVTVADKKPLWEDILEMKANSKGKGTVIEDWETDKDESDEDESEGARKEDGGRGKGASNARGRKGAEKKREQTRADGAADLKALRHARYKQGDRSRSAPAASDKALDNSRVRKQADRMKYSHWQKSKNK